MTQIQYSIVIVTRNRPEALALSLPLFLKQSRIPAIIYVIDSSDNPSKNIDLIEWLASEAPIPLRHQISPPGMTIQRNIGLSMVETPVVMFPDDDSLAYPDALEAMMRVYDLDTEGRVGGVCSAEARYPPEGALDQTQTPAYSMTLADRIKARIARIRYAAEGRAFRDPFSLAAERAYAAQGMALNAPAPSWLKSENAILVPWMTGFRMSFRTELIKRRGFDENLGRYALGEDIDASFSILRSHLIVGARDAQIYHHKAPNRRANGRALGAMHILNRAYILCRADQTDIDIRHVFYRFSYYKIAQYIAGCSSSFGRERLAGALAAFRLAPMLFEATPETLASCYLELRMECVKNES